MLDEPVASLDPIARRRFLQQVLEIASDNTRAVIFSTHIVSDLERVANRIWILKDGWLVWDGETDALKESVVRLHIRARAAAACGSRHPWRAVTASQCGWHERYRCGTRHASSGQRCTGGKAGSGYRARSARTGGHLPGDSS